MDLTIELLHAAYADLLLYQRTLPNLTLSETHWYLKGYASNRDIFSTEEIKQNREVFEEYDQRYKDSQYILYVDASVQQNHKDVIASGGAVLYQNDTDIWENQFDLPKFYGDIPTNSHIAEYHALLEALNLMLNTIDYPEWSRLTVYIDSENLVRQMKGTSRIRDITRRQLKQKILGHIAQFNDVQLFLCSRTKNQRADALAKSAN